MGLVVSFLDLLLYIAFIVFVAYVLLWIIQGFMQWTVDADVLKWGKIIVGLLCLIAVALWLSALVSGSPGLPRLIPYR